MASPLIGKGTFGNITVECAHGMGKLERSRSLFAAVSKDEDGDGNRKETDKNDERVGFTRLVEEVPCFRRTNTEGLKGGAKAMAEVGAKKSHCDGVKDDHRPALEAFDDHSVGALRAKFC